MRIKAIIAATILVSLAGLWAMYEMAFVASRGESSPLYSIYRHDPYGTAALAQLLQERGHSVSALRRARIEKQSGVLIQVLPLKAGSKGDDAEKGHHWRTNRLASLDSTALSNWIAEGNTVIQFARCETPLLAELLGRQPVDDTKKPGGAKASQESEPLARQIEDHEAAGALPQDTPGVMVTPAWTPRGRELKLDRPLSVRSPYVLANITQTRVAPLAISENVVAAEIPFGQGRLIFVGAPTPALNDGLSQAGNLDFILAVVGDKPVIFDEWSHGMGQQRGIMTLIAELGYRPVLAQIIFVLGLFIWGTMGHRPRDVESVRASRRGSDQIETLGYLYRQIHSPEQARACVAQTVRRRLAFALNCPQDNIEARAQGLPAEESTRVREMLLLCGGAKSARDLCRLLTESSAYLKEKKHAR